MNRLLYRAALPLVLFLLASGTIGHALPMGRMTIRVVDDKTGKPTPARIRITQAGKPVPAMPAESIAVSYGLWDHADGYALQPDSSFYVAGSFTMTLRPGTYTVTISKGNEYLRQVHPIRLTSGQVYRQTYRIKRWINQAARGWYSADGHVHIRRSPRDNEPLLDWMQAEDVNVGVLLKMGDFWETYYPQYAFGEKGVYQQGNYLLTPGQEDPRTPELGHALGFGASTSVRDGRNYYYYDQVFDELHKRGGLTGYAHQAESFHGYRGLTLDGLRDKVDVLEVIQYCVSAQPLHTEHYYRLLDLGFPLTATAGSDFPWCGHDHDHGPPERNAQIGNARFYTYINAPFTQTAWLASVAAGHTVATSGPILDFSVNKAIPGDHLAIKKGDKLTITAEAYGHLQQLPLEVLELVAHGRVLGRVTKHDLGQSSSHLAIKLDVNDVTQGMWIAARCYGDSTQAAHTTPVYVTVDGGGFHNPKSVNTYLSQCEHYLQELEQELETHHDTPEFRAWYYKKGLKTRIEETRQVLAGLRRRLATP
ncbi:CehA/McbA family metallohydrolase [Spirosoma migulaei]